MSDLVGNPEDRFSRVAAQIIVSHVCKLEVWQGGYKTVVMLNSVETKISSVYKYWNIQNSNSKVFVCVLLSFFFGV